MSYRYVLINKMPTLIKIKYQQKFEIFQKIYSYPQELQLIKKRTPIKMIENTFAIIIIKI